MFDYDKSSNQSSSGTWREACRRDIPRTILLPAELVEPVVLDEIDDFWVSWESLLLIPRSTLILFVQEYSITSVNSNDNNESLKNLKPIYSFNLIDHVITVWKQVYNSINNSLLILITNPIRSLFFYITFGNLTDLVTTSREVRSYELMITENELFSLHKYCIILFNPIRLD